MKQFLEELCTAQDWIFDYGFAAFQNLRNANNTSTKVHLFCDSVQSNESINEYGQTIGSTYTVSLMLVLPSNLSEDYCIRYANYIEPIKTIHYPALKTAFYCSNFVLQSIGYTEIVNSRALDLNCDGLLINLTATTYDQ
ncbi:hypothetical protein [Allomuricauda sp. M10]|uniref:hypothetical protein n=1 Tax=Allomuricauda sp. M10 TaxID=2683292 RepID=UPI001D1943B2|nr:hypothetical protein [Muricauda sp. M10]